ncbi:MAG: SRPBCC family protein, partial [Solirubrobacteraceae bacterium]
MSTVSAKIQIDAPIERVWQTVMDPRRLGDWVTIHRSVSNVSDSPLRAGSTMDQVMHMRGLTFKVRWTLMAVDSPRHAEWEGGGPAHSTAVIRYELARDEDDGTTFQYTNEFHVPGGRLGNAASRMIVGGISEREDTHS